jgi:hypothetical protein
MSRLFLTQTESIATSGSSLRETRPDIHLQAAVSFFGKGLRLFTVRGACLSEPPADLMSTIEDWITLTIYDFTAADELPLEELFRFVIVLRETAWLQSH